MDLGEGLRQAIAKLTRATIIDASTIKEFSKELQKTLLSADVEVSLVLEFTKSVEEKALKSKPPSGLAAKDYITNIVYDELVKLLGASYVPDMEARRILLLGLLRIRKDDQRSQAREVLPGQGTQRGADMLRRLKAGRLQAAQDAGGAGRTCPSTATRRRKTPSR